MSEYLVLIYSDEKAWESSDPVSAEKMMSKMMDEHRVFGETNGAALRGGNALEPTSSATSLRRDATGKLVVTDGAFAETKEALGGYYLIEAGDLDEAIAVASQVPAPYGGVEVRPIRVFD
ncbi:MAG TPA: YciI family protein [Acidimicrobiales bacterium]|nr:YciI family protein [Acidimicrobiales bacterium]